MSHTPEVVKSGYLTKSPPEGAPLMSQWRRRWFVLCDSSRAYPLAERSLRMEYYQSEEEVKRLADPKGRSRGGGGINGIMVCSSSISSNSSSSSSSNSSMNSSKYNVCSLQSHMNLLHVHIAPGVVDLKNCLKVVNREPVKGHKFVFDVHTNNRVFHLAAETAVEKHEWVQTLNNLLFTKPSEPPVSLCVCVCVCVLCMCACARVCVCCVCVHTCVCVCVCVHTCMCVCIHTCVCVYIMHVCARSCMAYRLLYTT